MNAFSKGRFARVVSAANRDRRFLLLCAAVGAVGGLIAIAFHLAITVMFDWVWRLGGAFGGQYRIFIMPLMPALGGLIVGICVNTFASAARGGGIPQTKAAFFNRFGFFRLSDIAYRFVFSSIFCGSGNSAGREGPTVHLCAASASVLAQKFGFSKQGVQASVPVGIGAGISASFNAPLSAVSFVFEELFGGFENSKSAGGLIIAVVVAAALSRVILGENPVVPVPYTEFHTGWWMFVCVPIGVAAGLSGHLFTSGILKLRAASRDSFKMPKFLLPAAGGLVVGIFATAAYCMSGWNSVFSIGYNSLVPAFEGRIALGAMLTLFAFKFVCTLINYAMGGSGGMFSGVIVIGGMLGGSFGGVMCAVFGLDASIVGACLMLGMGACLASMVRCPITSIVMIFELTLNYSLILPILVGNAISYFIATRLSPVGVYDSILLQDGISLKKMTAYRGQRDWAMLPVAAIMTFGVESVGSGERASEALARISASGSRHRAYPVLAPDGEYMGFAHLSAISAPENAGRPCSELVSVPPEIRVSPDASIRDAANYLIEKDVLETAVVSPRAPGRLAGMVTLHDIARQQNASSNFLGASSRF